jgi:NAD(P)-dependent dehydrogenase (short-subunit alcohol dehydrogenase family)
MHTQPIVLVTGASSGFGLATAMHLAAQGLRVFGTHLPHEAPPAVPAITWVPLDVTDDASVRACVAAAGALDVLVNNAGVIVLGALEETSLAQAQRLFDVNFWGVVRMTAALLPQMRARGRGLIVNVSSLAGLMGVPFEGFYAATKHAVEGYSESLRYEVRRFGVDVVLVEPGVAHTPLSKNKTLSAAPVPAYADLRTSAIAEWDQRIAEGTPAQAVAATIGQICAAHRDGRRPRLRYLVGQDAVMGAFGKRFFPYALFEHSVKVALRAATPAERWHPLSLLSALINAPLTLRAWWKRRAAQESHARKP